MSHTWETLGKSTVSPALHSPTLPAVKAVWFDSVWHSIRPFTFPQVLGRIFFSVLAEMTGGRKTEILNTCSHSGAASALKTESSISGDVPRSFDETEPCQ